MAVTPKDRIFGTEEALGQGMMELFQTSKKNIRIMSDLDEEEILNLSLLYTWADMIDSQFLKTFCDNFLQLRVSRMRLGRREIVAIGSNTNNPEKKRIRSIKDMFSGIRV